VGKDSAIDALIAKARANGNAVTVYGVQMPMEPAEPLSEKQFQAAVVKEAKSMGLFDQSVQLEPVVPDITEKSFMARIVEAAHRNGWHVMDRLPKQASTNQMVGSFSISEPSGLGNSLIGSYVCKIVLLGEPFSKNRPRFSGRHAYTDTKTSEAEESIRTQILAANVKPDSDHLLGVDLLFRAKTGQRRDLDNQIKLVLDACNGFVWRDDFQVIQINAVSERRCDQPSTHLAVKRIKRYTQDCKRCGELILSVSKSKGNRSRKGYCSRACYDLAQRDGFMVYCPECLSPIYRQKSEESKAKFCNKDCMAKHRKGTRQVRSDDGFPDIYLIRGTQKLVANLQVANQPLTEAQTSWINDFAQAGVENHLWRPEQWAEIMERLA